MSVDVQPASAGVGLAATGTGFVTAVATVGRATAVASEAEDVTMAGRATAVASAPADVPVAGRATVVAVAGGSGLGKADCAGAGVSSRIPICSSRNLD